jgi:transcriptional regulator with XRE-family HTH domain
MRLKQTRLALNRSQASFCQLVCIEPQAWNNCERGRSRIGVDQAVKVCEATGVSLDWIYRGMIAGVRFELAVVLQQQARTDQESGGRSE